MMNTVFKWVTASVVTVSLIVPLAQAESLFRASATYNTQQAAFTPRSLFVQPTPKGVGDMLTIIIDEQTTSGTNTQLRMTRNQTVEQNGTNIINRMLHAVGVPEKIGLPNFNGLDNQNQMESRVDNIRNSSLRERVACQVVQVLPNGYLAVQGIKTTMMSKERQDMVVTGIVNPYYVNRQNEVQSRQVANLQMMVTGKGVVSRQQNDGLVNKIYQFFN